MEIRLVTGWALFSDDRASVNTRLLDVALAGLMYWAVDGVGSLIGTFMPIAQPDSNNGAMIANSLEERRNVLIETSR